MTPSGLREHSLGLPIGLVMETWYHFLLHE
jgi:hypothetical protein